LNVKDKTPWIWNPETGTKEVYPYEGDGHILDIELVPAGSILIVFSPDSKGEVYHQLPHEGNAKILQGSWQVELHYPDNSSKAITLNQLVDFQQRQDLKSFGGKAVYRLRFAATETDAFHLLDLGKVYEISEVRLNNKLLGMRWYGRHAYELGDSLVNGENILEITVLKCLGNYCKLLTQNATAQYWTVGMEQPFYPSGLVGPVRLL
jgi:hypothetical protein